MWMYFVLFGYVSVIFAHIRLHSVRRRSRWKMQPYIHTLVYYVYVYNHTSNFSILSALALHWKLAQIK